MIVDNYDVLMMIINILTVQYGIDCIDVVVEIDMTQKY